MNEEAKLFLERILGKNPEELLQEEIDFLNARLSYLNNEHKRIFASVLRNAPEETKKNDVVEPAPVIPEPAQQPQTQYTVPTEETLPDNTPAEVTPEVVAPQVDEENPYSGTLSADPDQA